MTTLERAQHLAADFYVFGGKPRLADRTIDSTASLTALTVVLAVDSEAAYLADCRVPQLLILPGTQDTAEPLAPGAIIKPSAATVNASPDEVADAYQDINTALAYALARETQRNGGQLTLEQAALISQATAELHSTAVEPSAASPAPIEPPTPTAVAPAASDGANEVGVELTAIQVRQLLSQQISQPEEVTAAVSRLIDKQGSIRVMDGRAELLYSEETKTFIAAMEPRDKRAFDENLTTLQATATSSADDIEAAAFDEADTKERSL